ncbi:hypothetical protein OXT66_02245 [Lentilactobacillus senioris]|uniref:hypothetical protein n=1 Tax=Lentilactobacillus senioris TaxID=931534 RepID=UPI00227E36AD|nr:hypothetical protein [Lentilactobacillus senioris]MCY9806368.1 hypothetical protein [Lentilactobacillus senioris]
MIKQNLEKQIINHIQVNQYQNRPIVIGITGNIASGKTTLAQKIYDLCYQEFPSLICNLVSTDDFLLDNKKLQRRQLMKYKGFPISYDQTMIDKFVMAINHNRLINIPCYNHVMNDVDKQHLKQIFMPDIIVLEGLMVMQPKFRSMLTMSLFLNTNLDQNFQWYVKRCHDLGLNKIYQLNWEDYNKFIRQAWQQINIPNFVENVLPFREQADFQLDISADHQIEQIRSITAQTMTTKMVGI